ncbi:PadR family transcriptional regulator [Antrihabitans cavernicola]|uniref:PadR family transcriptional regulator n=1 Tax=Antrihabitans cavernicola TaxID=2495913 RepID=A0A5A7S6I7_9NOCA|nr:PadR family transcriptional regulator [Spelaeibacter cavernicola]KAA0021496.1 PadR family transcriptional regulator [Spelaeibacter cavernicola]
MGARKKFSRANPLALAVLSLLYERQMHPYQMSQTLKDRGKQDSVRLNFGSLYSVVESLVRQGFVKPVATEQDGNRPARTIYDLTDAGTDEVLAWMRDLVREPVKEYPQFMAALSFLPILSPTEAGTLLHERAQAVRDRIADMQHEIDEVDAVLPELFVIESQYEIAVARAELAFVESLAGKIESGTLRGSGLWQKLHDRMAALGVTRPPSSEIDKIFVEMEVPLPRGNNG